jgi:hypothetical protein
MCHGTFQLLSKASDFFSCCTYFEYPLRNLLPLLMLHMDFLSLSKHVRMYYFKTGQDRFFWNPLQLIILQRWIIRHILKYSHCYTSYKYSNYINNQQINYSINDVCYSHCSHQNVSGSIPPYSGRNYCYKNTNLCIWLCHHHSIIHRKYLSVFVRHLYMLDPISARKMKHYKKNPKSKLNKYKFSL